MAVQNKTQFAAQVDTNIDNTGSGGTSGQDVEDLFENLSDSVRHQGSNITLGSDPTIFDCSNFDLRSGTGTITGDLTVAFQKSIAQGKYRMALAKSTDNDVDLTITHTGLTVITPNEAGYVTLSGPSGDIFLIEVERVGSYFVVKTKYDHQKTSQVRVAVSSAEILAINTTPKLLIAAPGAGFAIRLLNADYDYEYSNAAYAGTGASNMRLQYGNTGTAVVTGTFGIVWNEDRYVGLDLSGEPQTTKTSMDNEGIYLTSTADPTSGSGDLEFILDYKVIKLR